MRVIIYVEGKSDRLAMELLLKQVIETKQNHGIKIQFFSGKGSNNQRGGDAKKELLSEIPKTAINILKNYPDSIVAVIPDLYPPNKGFPHTSYRELETGMMSNFNQELTRQGINDQRLIERFRVFCFKYDLEALVLAAETQLRTRLGLRKNQQFNIAWQIPVEDQNHNQPPSKIVEKLFKAYNKAYQKTVDSVVILGNADYHDIAEKCPQCFKPFIEFLENLTIE